MAIVRITHQTNTTIFFLTTRTGCTDIALRADETTAPRVARVALLISAHVFSNILGRDQRLAEYVGLTNTCVFVFPFRKVCGFGAFAFGAKPDAAIRTPIFSMMQERKKGTRETFGCEERERERDNREEMRQRWQQDIRYIHSCP